MSAEWLWLLLPVGSFLAAFYLPADAGHQYKPNDRVSQSADDELIQH